LSELLVQHPRKETHKTSDAFLSWRKERKGKKKIVGHVMPEDGRKTGRCRGGDAAKLREDAEQIGPAIAIFLFFANLYTFLSSSTPILFRV
jgi:hypothetical protein